MKKKMLTVEELRALDRPLTLAEADRLRLEDSSDGWFVGPGAWDNDD